MSKKDEGSKINIKGIIVFLVIFVGLSLATAIFRYYSNNDEVLLAGQREPWDYTIYHTYVLEPEENATNTTVCPVTKLYVDSICNITCVNETWYMFDVNIPEGTATKAIHLNLSSENCTAACEGVFVDYSCGGLPE